MSRNRWVVAGGSIFLALSLSACGSTPTETATPQPETERTITHAMGTTTINGTPQRVVVLDTGELDSVIALGVRPVGAVRADVNTELLGYLKDKVQGVELVGTIQDPNLEKIAALEPDLILGSKLRLADKYQALSQIGPTVFTEKVGVTWKENFLLHADALGKKAEAETMLNDYKTKAADTGTKAGDPSKLQVSVVRFMPQGKGVRLYAQGSFIGTILTDAGLARPASQQATDKTFVEVSPEQIAEGDGDVIFYASYGPTTGTKQDQVTTGPLWQSLEAVRAGKATQVQDDLWFLGIGIGAANAVLDELGKHLEQMTRG
jgi:iron complex transport system substrate-binding protein